MFSPKTIKNKSRNQSGNKYSKLFLTSNPGNYNMLFNDAEANFGNIGN